MSEQFHYPSREEEDELIRLANKLGRPTGSVKILTTKQAINMNLQDTLKEYVYEYQGPPAERRFCREMKKAKKFYTKQEINIMSFKGKNKSFGHRGQNYSIFKYKGGPWCRHRFYKYALLEDKSGREYRVAIGPAEGVAGEYRNPGNNFFRHPDSTK